MGFYNNEITLSRAIESIVNQTYDNWELIMCDDGSTDKSYIIAEEYRNKFSGRIVLLRNSHNMHLANALNRCLEVSTGEYIARMDADDESVSTRFEKQVNFLSARPDCILCGTGCVIFDEISGSEKIVECVETPDKYTIYSHTPFNHATIMCHKRLYTELGKYSESSIAIRCEDKDLWYRFFAAGYKGCNINEPLYKVYENESSIYRRTPRSRWNIFLTNIKGYKKLDFPWYWYYKPFLNVLKILVPRRLLILIKMRRSNRERKNIAI